MALSWRKLVSLDVYTIQYSMVLCIRWALAILRTVLLHIAISATSCRAVLRITTPNELIHHTLC